MKTKLAIITRPLLLVSIFASIHLLAHATVEGNQQKSCKLTKIAVQRLPDLNIARYGHNVFLANGELTVVGGHTAGFVLTRTAEYYKDGKWHELQMVYNHNGGLCLPLKNGKVLLAGGFEKNLGIGQTYEVEMYDPATHSFNGFSCLAVKRAAGNAVEVDSGHVVITGNWYHTDTIEYFNGHYLFSPVKGVAVARTRPYLFRTSDNDVLMISGHGIHGEPLYSDVADRLKGDPIHIPLFKTWQPAETGMPPYSRDCMIGNEDKRDFRYLLPIDNAKGQVALAQVRDTSVTLFPTECPIPTKGRYGKIKYFTPFVADHKAQRGYIIGADNTYHFYVLCVDYSKSPAPITLYYTDPMPDAGGTTPVVMPNGDLVMAGGMNGEGTNFAPYASVYLFPLGTPTADATSHVSPWWWLLVPAIILVAVLFLVVRRKQQQKKESIATPTENLLIPRIRQLMDEQSPYLNSELKLQDIASLLGTNSRYVSDSIKQAEQCSFSTFINKYRIAYAQQLMRRQPNIKLTEVYLKSGFANEISFFRTFKTIVGMTPKEWKTKEMANDK